MNCIGSKDRLAKHILPIILKNRKENQLFIEPFSGGCNITDKVTGNRWANDNHKYLIELYKAILNGWIPPDTITIEEYTKVRYNMNDYPPYYVGFVGFGSSYARGWFNSYARGGNRNYAKETKNNLLKQKSKLQNVLFTCLNYNEMDIPDGSMIYCDPPYLNTRKYKGTSFSHNEFYTWVRRISNNNEVYISEYYMPDDFEKILSIRVSHMLSNKHKHSRKPNRVENLYKLKK